MFSKVSPEIQEKILEYQRLSLYTFSRGSYHYVFKHLSSFINNVSPADQARVLSLFCDPLMPKSCWDIVFRALDVDQDPKTRLDPDQLYLWVRGYEELCKIIPTTPGLGALLNERRDEWGRILVHNFDRFGSEAYCLQELRKMYAAREIEAADDGKFLSELFRKRLLVSISSACGEILR